MISQKIVSLNKQTIGAKKFIIGLHLSKDQHPINNKGKSFKFIRFVGPAAEGKKFFHHTLARPDKEQPNQIDLVDWVRSMRIN